MSQLLNLDINNVGHMIGGLVFAYATIYFIRKRFFPWATAGLGILAGVAANLIWEVAVDVWKLWPSMADSNGFDPYDPYFRGLSGAAIIAGLYLIFWRKQ